jgi:hypothetical protein
MSNPIEIHAWECSQIPLGTHTFTLTDGRTLSATVVGVHEYAYTVIDADGAADVLSHNRYLWYRDVFCRL